MIKSLILIVAVISMTLAFPQVQQQSSEEGVTGPNGGVTGQHAGHHGGSHHGHNKANNNAVPTNNEEPAVPVYQERKRRDANEYGMGGMNEGGFGLGQNGGGFGMEGGERRHEGHHHEGGHEGGQMGGMMGGGMGGFEGGMNGQEQRNW